MSFQEEVIMNPNYSNMDLSDVMLSTNKEKLKWVCIKKFCII